MSESEHIDSPPPAAQPLETPPRAALTGREFLGDTTGPDDLPHPATPPRAAPPQAAVTGGIFLGSTINLSLELGIDGRLIAVEYARLCADGVTPRTADELTDLLLVQEVLVERTQDLVKKLQPPSRLPMTPTGAPPALDRLVRTQDCQMTPLGAPSLPLRPRSRSRGTGRVDTGRGASRYVKAERLSASGSTP